VKITQKIGQRGATKKITRFEKKIEAALESNDKTEINKLKKQLIEFIKSNNVYYQAKKGEAQQLLKQLESGSTINHSDSSKTLPFCAQIGLGMGTVLAVLFFTLLI
ncbi:13458_t:CDS:1, partial [Funneliformis geosporum]